MPLTQEAAAVGEHVALPDHQLRHEAMQRGGVAGAEHPVLDRADGREFVDQSSTFVRCQNPAGGVGVEQTEGDIGPVRDVAQQLPGRFVAPRLEVGRDQEADVRSRRRRVLRQLDRLEHVRAGRAGLDECARLDGPDLFDRYLQESLALGRRQRPALPDESAHPDPVVVQGADAVGDERTERLLRQSPRLRVR